MTVWLPTLAAVILVPGCATAAPPDGRSADAARTTDLRSANAGTASVESRSIRIAYHDLDIATPQGIAALYVRIRRAAAEVCDANRSLTGTHLVRPQLEACVRRSVVATVRQIGVPGLAALDAEQQVLSDEASERPNCEAPIRAKIII